MTLIRAIFAVFFLVLATLRPYPLSGDELLKKGFDLIREGDAYFREGEPSAAYQRYMEALKIFPTWFLPNLRLGIVSKHLGLPSETVFGYLKRAYEFDPGNSEVLYHLGVFEIESGNASKGEEYLRKCAEKNDRGLRCRLALAQSLIKQNKNVEAIAEYESILQRYIFCEPALSAVADLYMKEGEFEKALKNLEILLKISKFPSRVYERINLIQRAREGKKNP